jgi:protein TonB
MHLFPSPYNTGPYTCERPGETPRPRFSAFIAVSALLHLIALCSSANWRRNSDTPLFTGSDVIKIDLVGMPGPAPSIIPEGKSPIVEPGFEGTGAAAAAPQAAPSIPVVEEKPQPSSKSTERTAKAAPVKTEAEAAIETADTPSLPARNAVNKTTRWTARPADASGKTIPENAGGSARTDTPMAEKTGSTARVKQAASAIRDSPGQGYAHETFWYIQNRITRNLTYPVVARRMKWQGTVVVSFEVLEDGTVHHIKVVTGSGHNILDKNVVETIKQVQPFPAPPATAEFTMPIKYTLRP